MEGRAMGEHARQMTPWQTADANQAIKEGVDD